VFAAGGEKLPLCQSVPALRWMSHLKRPSPSTRSLMITERRLRTDKMLSMLFREGLFFCTGGCFKGVAADSGFGFHQAGRRNGSLAEDPVWRQGNHFS